MTEQQAVRPDFFIVGAPKSGTTSLWKALLRHPQVFMPQNVKEPHFFGTDLKAPYFVRDEAAYLRLFAPANGARRVGEASPWYMYSRQAAEEIRDFNPQARIIATLRNPVDMMYSLHSQRLYDGGENLEDFADALGAEEARRMGERLPDRHSGPKEGLLYREVARYSGQLDRFIRAFGRESVHVIIFEDIKRDAAGVFRRLLRFLEVDEIVEEGFPRANVNKRVRSTHLRDWLRSAPDQSAFGLGRSLVPKPIRSQVRRWVQRMNTRIEVRPPMDPELRASLLLEMQPEVRQISELLGRDLTVEWGE